MDEENTLKLASVDYVGDLLEGKQNKLTAGENITITEDNVINASAGGSGELKAKTWLCTFLDKAVEAGCGFNKLGEVEQPAVENHRVYDITDASYVTAIIKFKEAKSMTEVNNWLMHDFIVENRC